MSSMIKTTRELRAFLLEAMQDVRSGKLPREDALACVRIATAINESILAEVKVVEAVKQHATEVGHLVLAGEAPKPLSAQGRIIDRRPNGETHNFGDPPPGRSALDARRATEV